MFDTLDVFNSILRGIFISILYLQVTQANDTNLKNVLVFAFFYTVMFNGAKIAGIDPVIITNAFLTKTVFTLVDDRIKRPEGQDPNK